ncbi:MAG: hypothetical protein WC804_07175 [Sphingomonas sp.]|jgi:hypothetical protein|uniref:hypothetical protein n=1 Tax=Sphingomonas sp. TaxID=28214 RepID=UPI003563A8DC
MLSVVELYRLVHATRVALERKDRLAGAGIAEDDAALRPGFDAPSKDSPTTGILAALSDPSARRDG